MKYDWHCVKGFHSKNECLQIVNYLKSNVSHSLEDFKAIGVVKTSHVDVCVYGQVRDALEKIKHMVMKVNQTDFGFDLYEPSNYDVVHLNTYDSSNFGEYQWHSDGTKNDCWDSKLTVLLNLSTEEYTGGEFQLFLNEPFHVQDFDNPGSLLIFPSFLHHRVNPVKSGKRISLAQFFLGPNFR